MGVVYTWEQARNRHFPTKGIYDGVVKKLRQDMPRIDGILCATLYGSIVHGDFNYRRSDVDCFVLYQDIAATGEPFASLRQLVEWARTCNVHLNITPCPVAQIQTMLHRVGPQFYRHIQHGFDNRGGICGNFGDYIFSTESAISELTSYLRTKHYNLQEAFIAYGAFSDIEKVRFLQKVLEAPMHVARGMSEWYCGRRLGPKAAVFDVYRDYVSSRYCEMLQELLLLDVAYTACLQEVSKGKFREDEYQNTLAQIFAQTPKTLAFIAENFVILNKERSAR